MPYFIILCRTGWLILTAVSLWNFWLDKSSISWLLAVLSGLCPLLLHFAREGKSWDRTFLNILIFSLHAVAAAVILAQWGVVNAGSPRIGMIPFLAYVMWFACERYSSSQTR